MPKGSLNAAGMDRRKNPDPNFRHGYGMTKLSFEKKDRDSKRRGSGQSLSRSAKKSLNPFLRSITEPDRYDLKRTAKRSKRKGR